MNTRSSSYVVALTVCLLVSPAARSQFNPTGQAQERQPIGIASTPSNPTQSTQPQGPPDPSVKQPASISQDQPPTQQNLGSGSSTSKNTQQRFTEAIAVITNPKLSGYYVSQPASNKCAEKDKLIQIHWQGGSSASHLGRSGEYCFQLDDINMALYSYSFAGTVPPITNTPWDLMKDAISSVTSLSTGTSSSKPPPDVHAPTCTLNKTDLDSATAASNQLAQALSALDPGKDSNGKPNSIGHSTTKGIYDQKTKPAFDDFEAKISKIVGEMGTTWNTSGCDDAFAQAESLVETYVTIRQRVLDFGSALTGPQVAPYRTSLEEIAPYNLCATEANAGSATNAKTNPSCYSFSPLYSLVTSSAGFLITTIPNRSYSSVTAPNPSNPTTGTQSVLGVDYGSGVTPALTALLNVNPPYVNWENIGVGISAGVSFNIANGKADTSRFGFLGGVSLRLTEHLYLTPGVNIAQFADFPQGYTHAGQVIPPNTGTPTATNRYTVKFGFGITYKLKDLYSPKDSAQQTPASSPNPSTQEPATNSPTKQKSGSKPASTVP